MLRYSYVFIALLIAACGGNKDDAEQGAAADDPNAVGAIVPTVDAGPPPPPPKLPIDPLFAEGADEKAELDKINAIPAFDAVVLRPKYLARNGQSGVIYGRLGKEVDERYHWLVDETDGEGSLAVRIIVADNVEVKLGDRIVVWGAWKVDDQSHFYWDPTKLASLPPATEPMSDTVPFELATVDAAPDGAVPVSKLQRWGDIIFEVISSPRWVGDGWVVGDRSSWGQVAIVRMPGEREVYGAQYHYSDSERWNLEKDVRYTVRVDRFQKPKKVKGSKSLPIMTALGPPRIVKPSEDDGSKKKKKKKEKKADKKTVDKKKDDKKKDAPKKKASDKDEKET